MLFSFKYLFENSIVAGMLYVYFHCSFHKNCCDRFPTALCNFTHHTTITLMMIAMILITKHQHEHMHTSGSVLELNQSWTGTSLVIVALVNIAHSRDSSGFSGPLVAYHHHLRGKKASAVPKWRRRRSWRRGGEWSGGMGEWG